MRIGRMLGLGRLVVGSRMWIGGLVEKTLDRG